MDYDSLASLLRALCRGETDAVALMATVACEVHHAHPLADWTGFYRVTGPEVLKIGPYQGGHGCLVIPFSRGVCGAAARSGQVQLVPDVNAFPGHIACAASTRSELVLPVWNGQGRLLGVLDLDSDTKAAFTQEDADRLAEILAETFRDAVAQTGGHPPAGG
ncbi:MAG: GAF domain-containing protein [Rhodobacter sp.]|jgi:L-methionine (R)-S-oxide reductase|nr:GAF domain-containing protein [Rhodobacter sp.]